MTKSDLVERLVEIGAVTTRKGAHHLVEVVFEVMKKTLASGENIKLSGFGNFVARNKVARLGRNPKTGEKIVLDGRKVVRFRTSAILKTKMNGR
jgi:integration host factor subunit alpha